MTNRNAAIVRAEKLRAIMAMPEYKELIGTWLNDAATQAIHALTEATEAHELHRAQGGYQALTALTTQFDQVFAREAAAIAQMQKKKGDSV
jgi:hypothetical protein